MNHDEVGVATSRPEPANLSRPHDKAGAESCRSSTAMVHGHGERALPGACRRTTAGRLLSLLVLALWATEARAEVAFVAATSASATTGTLTINKPFGTVRDQLMVAFISVRPETAIIMAPAGWTLVRRTDNPNPGTATSLASYYKAATMSEPSAYIWSFIGTTDSVGGIETFRGVDVDAPIDAHGGQSTAGTAHAAPSVTAPAASRMLVTGHEMSSSVTWTPPAGLTEAFDVANLPVPNSGGLSMEGNYGLTAAAGPTGQLTANAAGEPDVGNAQVLVLAVSAPVDASPDLAPDTRSPEDVAIPADGVTLDAVASRDDGLTGASDASDDAAAAEEVGAGPDAGLPGPDTEGSGDSNDVGSTQQIINLRVGCACALAGREPPGPPLLVALLLLAVALRRRT